jgi:hypothetical protein
MAAQHRIDVANSFQTEHGGFPSYKPLKPIMDALKSISQRVDSNGDPIVNELIKALQMPAVAEKTMAITKTGQWIYLTEEPIRLGERWQLPYYTGFDFKRFLRSGAEVDDVINPKVRGKVDWEAPQSKFSRKSLSKLNRIHDAPWEQTLLDIMLDLHDESQIDPILKLELLKTLLKVGSTGSIYFKEEFAPHLESLAKVQIPPGLNWINPYNPSVPAERERALIALQSLKEPQQRAKTVLKKLESLNRPSLGPRYRWIGWLYRESSSRWNIGGLSRRDATTASGDLAVLYHTQTGRSARFREIGKLSAGTFELSVELPRNRRFGALTEGRPVYLLISATSR